MNSANQTNHQTLLEAYFDTTLLEIDRACTTVGPDIYRLFNAVYEDDLWNILLLKQYGRYENILKVLPDWPSEAVQRAWVGNHGFELSKQTLSFYKNVKAYYRNIGSKPLDAANLLDFGSGWGRIIRYFAKEVPPESLCGCEPDGQILESCRELRVPGILRRSDYRPKRLPFERKFDLVYAFSVFTHLSELAHLEALEAIHDAMQPGGLLVVTIRPRAFIDQRGIELNNAGENEIRRIYERYDRGSYSFFPYNLAPVDGDITYGEACVPYAYIRQKWTKLFKLLGAGLFCADMMQVPVLLQKRR